MSTPSFFARRGRSVSSLVMSMGPEGHYSRRSRWLLQLQVGEDSEVGHAVSELGSLLNACTPPGEPLMSSDEMEKMLGTWPRLRRSD